MKRIAFISHIEWNDYVELSFQICMYQMRDWTMSSNPEEHCSRKKRTVIRRQSSLKESQQVATAGSHVSRIDAIQ